jgi:hypothetical protein
VSNLREQVADLHGLGMGRQVLVELGRPAVIAASLDPEHAVHVLRPDLRVS